MNVLEMKNIAKLIFIWMRLESKEKYNRNEKEKSCIVKFEEII